MISCTRVRNNNALGKISETAGGKNGAVVLRVSKAKSEGLALTEKSSLIIGRKQVCIDANAYRWK